jgi:hypothetical protein
VLSDDEFELAKRIAVALERIAEHFDPTVKKERKAATLGTASYTDEERERLRGRESLQRKAQKQAG